MGTPSTFPPDFRIWSVCEACAGNVACLPFFRVPPSRRLGVSDSALKFCIKSGGRMNVGTRFHFEACQQGWLSTDESQTRKISLDFIEEILHFSRIDSAVAVSRSGPVHHQFSCDLVPCIVSFLAIWSRTSSRDRSRASSSTPLAYTPAYTGTWEFYNQHIVANPSCGPHISPSQHGEDPISICEPTTLATSSYYPKRIGRCLSPKRSSFLVSLRRV